MSDYADIEHEKLVDVARVLRGRAFVGLLSDAFSSSDTKIFDAVEAAGRLRITEDEVEDMILNRVQDSFSAPLALAAIEIVAQSAFENRTLPTPFSTVPEVTLAWQTLHLYEEETDRIEQMLITLIDDLDAIIAKYPPPAGSAYPGEVWEVGAATRASCVSVAGMINSAPLMRKCLTGLTAKWIKSEVLGFHEDEPRICSSIGVAKDFQEVHIAPMFWAVAFSSSSALNAALEIFPDALDDCVRIGSLGGVHRNASIWEYLQLARGSQTVDVDFFMTWMRHQKTADGSLRPVAATIFSNHIEPQLSPAGWPHLVEPAIDLGLYENPSKDSVQLALLNGNSEIVGHVIERGHLHIPDLEPVTLSSGVTVRGFGRGHPLNALAWGLRQTSSVRFGEMEITLCRVIEHIVNTGDSHQIAALATGWLDDGETLQHVCAYHGMRATLRMLCEHGLDPSLVGLVELAEKRGHLKLASELRSLAAHMACDQVLLEFMQNDQSASSDRAANNANSITNTGGN